MEWMHCNPTAAVRVGTRLRAAISRLTVSPQIGRPVEDLPGGIRELIFGK
jgi:plasmid stabilization system protein ParE